MTTRILALLAVLALAVAACATDTETAGGPTEGIAVHGDWTIDIYDPDGTLVERTEFSNALDSFGGPQTLTRLLAGTRVAGNWNIQYLGDCDPSCSIGQNIDPVVSILGDGTTVPYYLELTGSTDALDAGTIERVSTSLSTCDEITSPVNCGGAGGARFTSTDLALADQVDIAVGQTVQITVEISFTTG